MQGLKSLARLDDGLSPRIAPLTGKETSPAVPSTTVAAVRTAG